MIETQSLMGTVQLGRAKHFKILAVLDVILGTFLDPFYPNKKLQ